MLVPIDVVLNATVHLKGVHVQDEVEHMLAACAQSYKKWYACVRSTKICEVVKVGLREIYNHMHF